MDKNDNKPLISLVVPVYNVEKYVKKCVESIMHQTYPHIEIILVDDGSTDASGHILDELAKEDERVRVVHQKNAGVSSARNQGLEIAGGEYIMFVDGDDYIEPDYAEYFNKLLESTGADMAVGLNNFSVESQCQVEQDNTEIWTDMRVIEQIYLGAVNVAVWNKIYKKAIIDENGLRFDPSIWYGEGMLFNIEYLQCVDKVGVGKRRVYHQICNPESAMRKFNLKSNFCGMRSLEVQRSSWKKKNERIETAWKYHYRNFSESILCGLVATDTVKQHQDVYNKCKANMRKNLLLPWKVDVPVGRKLRLTLFAVMPGIIAKRRKRKAIRAAAMQELLYEQ